MNEEKRNSAKWKKAVKTAYGFTLIEVIIVIAILAIVTAIAYPNFQRIVVNSNLRTAARDMAADVARLKERALAEYRIYRLTIDQNNNTYTLERCANQGGVCNGVWDQPLQKSLANVANGIVFDSTTATLFRFEPRGTLNPGDIGTIRLRNSLNFTARIGINVTGRANVQFTQE